MTFREAIEQIKAAEGTAQRMAIYYGLGSMYGRDHSERARGLREALAILANVREPGIAATGTATADRFREVMEAGKGR